MSYKGIMRLRNGSMAELWNDRWKCENKLIEFWLNLRYGRLMKIASYRYAPSIRFAKAIHAFQAEAIEIPIDESEDTDKFY